MSTKRKHLYTMAWRELLDICAEACRPVTAGEFARHMGIARSTAVRWLTDMLAEGAVVSFRGVGANHLPVSVYEPIGRKETWNYAYGENWHETEQWGREDF